MNKFDPDRPFGQIGGDFHGAKFEQDGKLFDAAGCEVVLPVVEAKQRGRPRKVDSVDAQIEENLNVAT